MALEFDVPILWRSELRSALAGYIGRGTLNVENASGIMTAAQTDLAGCEHVVASRAVLEIAASSGLSAYDCEFVALAQSLAVPLVTQDRAVLKAFPDLAMTMEGFLHEKRAGYRRGTRHK